jgi:hypothetical protein
MQSGKVKAAGLVQGNSEAPAPLVESGQGSLRTIVREALLNVLKDQDASAAAKASAGRTLLQYFTDESPQSRRRGADMTAAELDAALAQLGE